MLLIAIILMAIVFLGLGIKLLFNPAGEARLHSCSLPDEDMGSEGCMCRREGKTSCHETKE